MRLEIVALSRLPEVRHGDDLASLLSQAASQEGQTIDRSVVLAVAQKIVSKAEGAVVDLRKIQPSALARSWAAEWGKDERLIELILAQSRRIVKMDRGVLIAETLMGFVCANAGVDQSNVEGDDFASVLPSDPDASAQRLLARLACGAVIITDTFGRPWREGLVEVALGCAGMDPLLDLRGRADLSGRELHHTVVALADEVAAAAGLVMEKDSAVAAAIVRGVRFTPGTAGATARLVRKPEFDLFR